MNVDYDFPPLDVLERQLTRALRSADVTVLDRAPNAYASRLASEVVSVRLASGESGRIFCKHGSPQSLDVHGLRSGPAYEAVVYRDVLASHRPRTAEFLGYAVDPSAARPLLALEHLDSFDRVQKSGDPDGLARAAAWIGQFHAVHENPPAPELLNVHDRAYYTGWVERAARWTDGLATLDPERFGDNLHRLLLEDPLTIVHGEYYPDNILVRDSEVCPVDWEWAAIAAGEIDLAALTEGWWPHDRVRACIQAYCEARWGAGPPTGFAQRLDAARIYLHLRWLGGRRDRATTDEAGRRAIEVEELARGLGLVPA